MTKSKDIRTLMQTHLLAAEPYRGVDPPGILAHRLNIPVESLVKLDANENPYGPSPKVAEALARYTDYHIYTDPQQRRVRDVLAGYTGVTPDKIVAGAGSDELIDLLLRLFAAPGDRVIQCVPTFGMYATFTHAVGADLVSVPLNETFDVDVEKVRQEYQNGAKLLFLSSPNNPTGNLVDAATVRQLLELDIVVVVDEAYFEFSHNTVVSLIAENSNLVVLRTLSKWAGLAGMRLGYGLMDSVVAERLMAIKPPYNINIAAEVALIASLEDKETLLNRVQTIVKEREYLFQQLSMISGVVPIPSHANFILCRLPEGKGRLVQQGLAKRGVLVRYYDATRLRDYIRVSVGLRYQNEALIEGLKATVL